MTDTATRMQTELFRALGLGVGHEDAKARALFQEALNRVNLTPQQETIIDVLFSLGRRNADADDNTRGSEPPDANEPDAARIDEEVRDLREVNDTVASALGACPLCWGGSADCQECGGRGKPGSKAPDPRLFERLVIPAVRRVANQAKEKMNERVR